MRLKGIWWAAFITAAGPACAWRRPAPICHLNLNLDLFPPWQPGPDDLDPALFSRLLLSGVSMDCTGRLLCGFEGHATLLQPARVQLVEHGPKVWLVWLQTHDAGDGTVMGPVAQVAVTYDKLEVQTLGQLRAAPRNVQLRLCPGPGGEVLEVRSDSCVDAAATDGCDADVQLLAARNHRFVTLPGSSVKLRRRQTVACGRGCRRTTTLEAELERMAETPWTYAVRERLTVEERAGPAESASPRESRTQRSLVLDGNAWRSDAPTLGDRIRAW